MAQAFTILLIVLGLVSALTGIVGCLLPVIPGPILSFLALILLSIAKNWEPFSSTFLIVMACLTVLVSIVDYVVPLSGAKRYGASRYGLWGSTIGMFIGIFFVPPLGMIIGAFIGALVGELLSGKAGDSALRAGWGVLMGNVVALVTKLAFAGVALFFYIRGMF
jgi:uncharacterized protein YqgC (DUF456 family)